MAKKAKKKRDLAEISKLSGESLDIRAGQIEKLKSLFPQTVKDGEIDFDALKLTVGGEADTNGQSYGLSWAGKADCFRHIQEATTATLKPVRKESMDFDDTENIFIEGDNLEVLKVLQKNYYGKIKMIYIDPPYNTGNDSFIYPDRFKEEKGQYEERAGIKDAEGLLTKDGFFRKNSKDTGHFHSNWLCMMYPRLFLAKNLLRQDGVIFVSIDDNEVHNLRMIMNEIFGEENFLIQLVWQNKEGGGGSDSKHFRKKHEYILCYARNLENTIIYGDPIGNEERYSLSDNHVKIRGPYYLQKLNQASIQYSENLDYPIETPDGTKIYPLQGEKRACWRWSKKKVKWGFENNFLEFKKDREGVWQLYSKQYLYVDNSGNKIERANPPIGVIDNFSTTNAAKKMELLLGYGVFSYSKPKELIIYLIQKVCDSNGIILDFFAGSCSTAHAVMQLNAEDGGNRKYICVQLAEPCDEKSEAYKAGYKTIADIGKERIRRAGKKIKKENTGKLDFDGGKLDLGLKVFKLDESNFKQWREDIKTGEELKEQLKMFVDNKEKGSAPEDMLYEIILKNSRFDLNVPVEKKTFDGIEYYRLATETTEKTEKKKGNHGLTQINTDFEIVCLAEKITKKLAEKILKEKPQKFTCLDTAFKNNDQLKTNTALQAEAAKIEFKVI